MKRIVFAVIAACVVVGLAFWLWPKSSVADGGMLKPYFSYSASDLSTLKSMKSEYELKQEDLAYWDNRMFELVKQHQLGDVYANRIYTYVYTAQNDAMALSYQVKGQLSGSIGPVTAKVLCALFPSDCDSIMSDKNDDYSNELARLVMTQIDKRMQEDALPEHHKLAELKIGPEYWAGVIPYFAQDVPSWIPWRVKNISEFKIDPAPAAADPFWKNQLEKTLQARRDSTEKQKLAVVFWAGGPGTITPPGQWVKFGNDYMVEHNTSLAKEITVRMMLAQAIADTCIAIFGEKYYNSIKRPFMMDPTLVTIMPTPNHPSHPAGHSTISATAEAILVHYFPENKKQWEDYAVEAGSSRIWGGIHFWADHEQGMKLGKRVGEAALSGK